MTLLLPSLALLAGLALLVWSADQFVDGASATATHFSVPPLLVGMVIVGFGTSAPEMVVSTLAASQGNPALALGNAWGSNIVNVAFILGVTALVSPILVRSVILKKELPVLLGVMALAGFLVWDTVISRVDAWVLLSVFFGLMGWSIWEGFRGKATHWATKPRPIWMPAHASAQGADRLGHRFGGVGGQFPIACVGRSDDCPIAGGERFGDRPDRGRRGHFPARAGVLHRGGTKG
ncbi:MAG: hypothetical protein R3E42_04480 [Burkholderiaceae bacterium]